MPSWHVLSYVCAKGDTKAFSTVKCPMHLAWTSLRDVIGVLRMQNPKHYLGACEDACPTQVHAQGCMHLYRARERRHTIKIHRKMARPENRPSHTSLAIGEVPN